MKKLLSALLLALVAFSVGAQTVSYEGVRQDVIVDVRTPAEFAMGHIKDAVNIPLDQLGSGIHTLKGISKDSHILLYCRTGRRSAMARDLLLQQGFRRVYDGGGMTALEPRLRTCGSRHC